jgi:hypothetical protein
MMDLYVGRLQYNYNVDSFPLFCVFFGVAFYRCFKTWGNNVIGFGNYL